MARMGIRTQSELADRMNAPKGQVSAWMSAENVELKTLFRFAKALQVSVESLVEHIDDDYDSMRQRDLSPLRVAELIGRLQEPVRTAYLEMLLALAGAPTPENEHSSGPPVE